MRRPGTTAVPLVAVPLVALAVVATGCGSEVTASRLEPSIATTFGQLYRTQQQLTGNAAPPVLQARARCQRGMDPGGPRTGAGPDWVCVVTYTGARGVGSSRLEVQAKPDGCWTADGSPLDVGPVTVRDGTTGATARNPLSQFDGCFDTSLGAD